MLLTESDLQTPTQAQLPAADDRAVHIRTILHDASLASTSLTLRVAVEGKFLHDESLATILPNGSVQLELPPQGRQALSEPPPVILLVAMQRPKVMQRLLGFAAALGVAGIIITATEKVEKTYWDCKLFRGEAECSEDATPQATGGENAAHNDVMLPGRARSKGQHPERDADELSRGTAWTAARRVDGLETVRRRLAEGVVQGAVDGSLPWVVLHRGGLRRVLRDADEVHGVAYEGRRRWSRVVAHARGARKCLTEAVRGDGVVVAIGPEGGWTEDEVEMLGREGFQVVGMGDRVLRSETAAVVALGLAHEGLRLTARSEAGMAEVDG